MVQEIHVEGIDAYRKAVQENKGKTVFAMFCGSKDAAGASWCPDCVVAEPVVTRNLKNAPEDAVLIHCSVGERSWCVHLRHFTAQITAKLEGPRQHIRKDPKLLLKSVPTLLKEGSRQRLEEAQCADDRLVQMFFEED